MRRLGPEEWSGLAMFVVSAVVGGPVILGTIEVSIPRPWWIALLAVFVVATVVVGGSGRPRWVRHSALAAAVVAAWAVVASAAQPGLLPVLLVVAAAVSAYAVPVWAGLAVVALNTVVLVLVMLRAGGGAPDVALVTGFYALIQVATLLSSLAIEREKRMRRKLTEAHVELQAASVLLSESARTAERLRISRDLHDLIGHQLTVLALELEAARHRDGERAREHVERAGQVARDLLADVRATVGRMRTESPDLTAALRRIVRDLPGLEVSIEVAPEVRVGEEQTVALVRAVQEVVTNTIRHAEARELWIDIAPDGDGVRLTATDDGRGAVAPVLGNGLSGLVERFEALGGDVSIDGRKGFQVIARAPAS
ncbi:signal transduction histidine kinase [Thermocatellispora tengchongensis]|uniref:Signal transduction histidine kinase n=1 Tax=Thermocatellispora tengchongensis TaxID=1073253 RepID=A0A840NXZ1_9ACTN|nr:histidine kinase [Thermocatellispora tengchongensis]MBB5133744.1 signal transduction histidine kinase [Thermocatellispora tengchongensis]